MGTGYCQRVRIKHEGSICPPTHQTLPLAPQGAKRHAGYERELNRYGPVGDILSKI